MRPEQTHALSALATLMEVPEEQQEQFIYNINASLDHIKEDWRVHDAVVVRGLSLGNLAAAVHKVTSELLKLSDDDRRLIDYTLYEMTERKRDLGEVARHHPSFPRADLFLPALAEACAALTGRNPASERTKGHRSKGDVKNWRLAVLMRMLFVMPIGYGGTPVPFDPKNGGGRKFKEAVELLRAVVPVGIIPKALPLSTVRDIREEARRRLPKKGQQYRR